jgi:phenylacetate-CoA ligase
MTIVGAMRHRAMSNDIVAASMLQAAHRDADRRRVDQLHRLNAVWRRAIGDVPAYIRLAQELRLLKFFESLAEFAALVPPLERSELRDDVEAHTHPRFRRGADRTTGGSSGEPLTIPTVRGEHRGATAAMWAARGAYGVLASSTMLLVWGHSHLLGTGIDGRLRRCRREVSDRLLGYRRVSTYALDATRLRAALDTILSTRPDVVLGYSGALDAIARANRDRTNLLGDAAPRAVIATAEGLPHANSREVIESVFRAPLALEYGAAETGVIAYSSPRAPDDLVVLSGHHLVEVAPDSANDTIGDVLVTSLFPRAVPLLRYRIGDRALVDSASLPGLDVSLLRNLRGRESQVIDLGARGAVHSELFAHAVRVEPAVVRYQLVLEKERVRLLVLTDATSSDAVHLVRRIADRLRRANGALTDIDVELVDQPSTTRAGKAPIVIDRREP